MPHLMFAAPLAALLLDVFWKSLPVFAVAGLAGLFLRRASAAARHALWLLTLAGLLCLTIFCALLPQWAAPVLPAAPRPQIAAPRQAPTVTVTPPQAATVAPDVSPSPVSRALVASHAPAITKAVLPPMPAVSVPPTYSVIPSHPTVSDWVCLAWFVGALLVLGRTLLSLAAASRLVHRCRLITAGPLVEAASDARQTLGLTRPLSLRVGPVAVPMTRGVARPVVLLPDGAEDWPAERLRAVLLHEAAHVKRLDWATMLLAHCVCALYGAHPLVWLAAHRLRAEAEGACDDLVLICGVPAPDYAAHLLEIVRGLASRRAALPSMVAMAHRPEVAGRLRTILDGHKPRRGVTRRGLALAAVAAVALLAPLAAIHPTNASNDIDPVDSQRADQPVQTISWVMTTHRYDASGRLSETQPSRSLIWLRSNPPGLGLVMVSNQGEVTYQNKHTAGEAKTTQIVEDNIRDFTSYPRVGASPNPPKTIGLSTWHFSPWQEKSVSLEGKQAILFTRDIHSTSASHDGPQQQLIHISRWFDPDSHRLIRGEQDVTGTDPNKYRVVDIDHDIRYNEPSPPGVFDGSLPPGSIFNGLSAHVAPVVGFRRYVSRPLPDGTRYTFLYPSYFTKVGPSSPDTDNSFDCADLGYSGTPIRWAAVKGGKIIAAHLYGAGDSSWSAPHQELLEVIVGRAGDVPFPTGSRSIRRDIRQVGPNGNHHDISITDARTHFRYLLVHEDMDTPALFAQTDPVISSSFRILPPGTSAVLSDAAPPPTAPLTLGPRIDHVAAKVDLTQRLGAIIQRTGDGVHLTFFGSKRVIWMPIDTRSLMVTSLHVNSWRIHDSAGNSLALTDNARQPVIVINRTENPLTLVSRAGSPALPITLPPNSMMFLNHVLSPLTVSGGSHGVSYRVSIQKTKFPLTIIRSPQPQMSMEGIPDYPINTDLN